jgi:hypothetical protein|tara:strand:- start:470 stop:937 length:468 start_codon:yes stop_codon:yes gene_type:complete
MAWGHGTTAADAEAYSGDFSGMPSAVEGINQGWIQQNPVPDVYKGIWAPGVKDLDFDLSRYYLEDDYKPPLPDEIVEQVHLRDRAYDFLTQGRMSGQLPWGTIGFNPIQGGLRFSGNPGTGPNFFGQPSGLFFQAGFNQDNPSFFGGFRGNWGGK